MEFSHQVFEAIDKADEEKTKCLVSGHEHEISLEMVIRALDMNLEDLAEVLLVNMFKQKTLTDEKAHRLMRHATACGMHKFLRLLVTLESADLVSSDEEGFKGFDLGRMDLSPIRPLKTHNTPLHLCVMEGEPISMVYLYALAMVPVNLQNKFGDSALHLAVRAANYEMSEALLQCGVSPLLRNKLGQTAAEAAAALGNDGLASMIRSYEPGLTAGLERGDARAVAHALRRWVSPHSVLDAAGDTRNGLAWAFDQGLEHTMSAGSVASLLLAHRVLAGNARSVKQLMADPEMDALLNVNLQHCDSGMTPLAAAVRNHDVTLVQELLKRGAVVNIRVHSVPLLSLAIQWDASFSIIEELLKHGDPSVWRERDPDGFTPFLRAIQCGRTVQDVSQLLALSPGRSCLAQRTSGNKLNARELAMELDRDLVVQAIDAAVERLFTESARSDGARAGLVGLAIAFYGESNFRAAAVGLEENRHTQRFLAGLPAIEEAGWALMRAVENSDYAGVKSLNRADYVDKNGFSALTRAIVLDQLEIADWLIAERPQLKFLGDNDNRYPLHFAYLLPEAVGDKFVSLLLERDGKKLQNLTDKDGRIPCHYRRIFTAEERSKLLTQVANLFPRGTKK